MHEFRGMGSNFSLPLLPGPLWPGVVAPDRVLWVKYNCFCMLNWIVWNRTVYKYKLDLALITYNGWCDIKLNQPRNHNYKSSITMPWTREEKYFASLLIWRQNPLKFSQNKCNHLYDNDLLLRQETQKKVACPGSWYNNI